ncbi:MAG: 16S rRNA (uracil(1498)-N(3))-methyltransferase [Acidobacteria bacterium]|nr:16S rRNA (uracil(1498)-N(3))-methyltransferase [Acidobacteriota bacterium]
MRRRFFVEQFSGDRAVMDGEAAHHVGRVLRAQPGQVYELSDGARVRLGRVENVTRDEVEFALLEEIPSYQPTVHTALLLAIVKFDAFEWALEKATELGVATIVPVAAARSEKGLIAGAAKRAERWQKILVGASEQSRRVRVPELREATRTADAFRAANAGLRVLLSEREAAQRLKEIVAGPNPDSIALAIGPEGGWTDEEFVEAAAAGFREASMGKTILRTETAVTAALACLNFALES